MSEINGENPWDIQSLYELLYFICPSCTYTHNSKEEFICHAFEFHPESEKYLRNIQDGSMELDLKPDLDNHDEDLPSFNGFELDIEEIYDENNTKILPKNNSQKSNPVVVIKPFKKEDYNCTFCNTFYHNHDLLTAHYKTFHGVKEENLETNLDFIDNNSTTLMPSIELKKEETMDYDENNELNNSNIVLIKCDQCNLTFDNENLIKEHVLIDHKDGRKNVHSFKCDACDE